jgi:hypothetical protein
MGLIDLCGAFMDKQFEKTSNGYVYRFNAKGPPVPVTARDHAHYVRRGGWSFLFHVAGLMLASSPQRCSPRAGFRTATMRAAWC